MIRCVLITLLVVALVGCSQKELSKTVDDVLWELLENIDERY